MKRLSIVRAGIWLALVLALVGSLRHVAWSFATLEGGDLVAGYVQAVAIDVGLFILALGIQQRKRERRSTWGLWLGVAVFSAISTYANLLFGLVHQNAIGLSDWEWLVSARPVLLSAVLPLLVLYLAEVAGSDVNYDVQRAQREAKRQERKRQRDASTAQMAATPDTLTLARATRKALAEQAVSALLAFYADNPGATQAQAGAAVGRSRQWVSAQLARLEEAGRIRRDGNGVEVLA